MVENWYSPCLGQRSLIPNFEIFLCLLNLLKLILWISLPHNHRSPTCKSVRPSVTIQLSLLPLCAEILSSWKSQWLSSSKIPNTREGSEHTLACASALNLTCALRFPDGFLTSGAPCSEDCWNIYALPLFAVWSCGVHARAGGGAGTHWPQGATPLLPHTTGNVSKEGTLVKVSFAEYVPKSTLGLSVARQSLVPCKGAAAALTKRGIKSESSPRTSCR